MLPLDSLHAFVRASNEAQFSFDIAHMWRAMGPFARFITGVLAVMSIYSLAVMAERLVVFRQAVRASCRFAAELRQLLPAGKLADAVALARSLDRGHLCRVLGLAIEEYQNGLATIASRGPSDHDGLDVVAAVSRSVERSSIRVVSDLRRGLGGLATVGSTAPFVGLLGTVAGIITAFQAMAATGSGGLGSVSSGIAEALVTTAFGLLVAIPAVMMFNYLTYRVDAMEVDIADAAGELVDFLIKEGRHRVAKPE